MYTDGSRGGRPTAGASNTNFGTNSGMFGSVSSPQRLQSLPGRSITNTYEVGGASSASIYSYGVRGANEGPHYPVGSGASQVLANQMYQSSRGYDGQGPQPSVSQQSSRGGVLPGLGYGQGQSSFASGPSNGQQYGRHGYDAANGMSAGNSGQRTPATVRGGGRLQPFDGGSGYNPGPGYGHGQYSGPGGQGTVHMGEEPSGRMVPSTPGAAGAGQQYGSAANTGGGGLRWRSDSSASGSSLAIGRSGGMAGQTGQDGAGDRLPPALRRAQAYGQAHHQQQQQMQQQPFFGAGGPGPDRSGTRSQQNRGRPLSKMGGPYDSGQGYGQGGSLPSIAQGNSLTGAVLTPGRYQSQPGQRLGEGEQNLQSRGGQYGQHQQQQQQQQQTGQYGGRTLTAAGGQRSVSSGPLAGGRPGDNDGYGHGPYDGQAGPSGGSGQGPASRGEGSGFITGSSSTFISPVRDSRDRSLSQTQGTGQWGQQGQSQGGTQYHGPTAGGQGQGQRSYSQPPSTRGSYTGQGGSLGQVQYAGQGQGQGQYGHGHGQLYGGPSSAGSGQLDGGPSIGSMSTYSGVSMGSTGTQNSAGSLPSRAGSGIEQSPYNQPVGQHQGGHARSAGPSGRIHTSGGQGAGGLTPARPTQQQTQTGNRAVPGAATPQRPISTQPQSQAPALTASDGSRTSNAAHVASMPAQLGSPQAGPAVGSGQGGGPRAAPNGTEDVIALPHRVVTSVAQVAAVGAVSWRGRNPAVTKINQDAVVVAEHGPTASLLVAVFDGHGVNGREVSSFFKERYPLALFTDRRFQSKAAASTAGQSDVGRSPAKNKTGSPSRGGKGDKGSDRGSDAGSVTDEESVYESGSQRSDSPGTGELKPGGVHGRGVRRGGAAASALCDIMADVLLATELALIQASGINVTLSGSTAVVVLIRDGILHVINVGDSRGILVSCPSATTPIAPAAIAAASAAATTTGNAAPGFVPGSGVGPGGRPAGPLDATNNSQSGGPEGLTHPSVRVRVLTVDHKPDAPRERQRILSTGGRVMATRIKGAPHLLGPPRVWLKNAPLPGLNMSRSLGDLIAKQAGVISTPHKAVHGLHGSGDRCLVLASDGLWDFVTNEEVASVGLSSTDTWEASARLARLARSRWLIRTGGADDTTVVIVRFGNPATQA